MSINSSIRRAFLLLTPKDRRKLMIVAGAQISLSLLDLTGMLLIGLVAALSAAASTGEVMNVGGLSRLLSDMPTNSTFVIVLGFAAGTALILKSMIGLWLTRRAYRFIANRQAVLAGGIAKRLLNRPLIEVQSRSSQETSLALTTGVNAITINTMGSAVVLISEISLVFVIFLGLLFVDPIVAAFTVFFFGLLTTVLQYALGTWARSLGRRQSTADIGSMTSVQHALRAYREVTVTGRRGLFVERFQTLRWEAAKVQADTFIISQIGKYVFEIGLIIGGGILVTLMAATRSVTAAIAIVAVFLIASTRIFPSLLRIQTAMANVRNSEGIASYTYELLDDLDITEKSYLAPEIPEPTAEQFNDSIHSGFPEFEASIIVDSVSVVYPGTSQPALNTISLSISPGESIALVGATGAGKSTLADVILGVLIPDSGSVTISGLPPYAAVQKWPGAMAYVPQDVAVLSGTVSENVGLGIPPEFIDHALVWEALDRAQLSTFLSESRDGIDTIVGENGVQLSGGQRQRLGIARALYSRPRLLVLDEATSALDADTERVITETIDSLAGDVTLIVIAHRLATIRHSNQVIYMEHGRIVGSGTFDQVRDVVPDFDHQASLLGL